jgi:hypothetical protein
MIRELIDTEVEAVVGGRKHGDSFHFNNIRLTNTETVTAKANGRDSTAAAQGGDQSNLFSVTIG